MQKIIAGKLLILIQGLVFLVAEDVHRIPCKNEDDCIGIDFAECTLTRVCECHWPFVIDIFNSSHCTPLPKYPGNDCQTNGQCNELLKNSLCVDGACKCIENYVYSSEQGICVQTTEVADNCTENEDCLAHAYCDNGKCLCKSNYQSTSDLSECRATLFGAICEVHEDCRAIANADCSYGYCACKWDFIPDHDNIFNCMPSPKSAGDRCRLDVDRCQEIGRSHCVNSTCQCDIGYPANDKGICVEALATPSGLPMMPLVVGLVFGLIFHSSNT